VNFTTPDAEELSFLRVDPLLQEEELDVRPDVADAIEHATGIRAGCVYWRTQHDHLYALELADLGRGRPSMATVYGHWDRFEPRPPEHEITSDLLEFSKWVAEVAESLNPADVANVALFARVRTSWAEGSVLRTPEERFMNLPDFSYEPKYVEFEGLRMAFVEHGSGDPILCLHGEPTWGFLYRRMIPTLGQYGRVIVPDLIGFGRSDKPVDANAYTYRSHTRWLRTFIAALGLQKITLVCQDWGGLIGLRALAQSPSRYAQLVAMNTGIPTGSRFSPEFGHWRRASQRATFLDIKRVMTNSLHRRTLTDAEIAAYAAPYPSPHYQMGALVFPRLVPIRPDHPGAYDNRVAVEVLRTLELPVLLPWGDADPITKSGEAELRSIFKNVAPPLWIENSGHFIQEDAGEEVAGHIVRWLSELRNT
jgi:haloalkane dehalogenase